MTEVSGTVPRGKPIRPGDILLGFDPPDLTTDSPRTDTLSEVAATVFANPPGSLTAAQAAAIRTLIAVLTEDEVDTRAEAQAEARYTDDEKSKLSSIELFLDLGGSPTQTGATFTFAAPSGYTAGGFSLSGQLVQFSINSIDSPDIRDTVIQVGADTYTLLGLSATAIPLEEFRPDTQYVALGKGTSLVLIGPTDLVADDVIDVTNTGLPPLDADNYKKFFIDHDTPRVWVGHRENVPWDAGSR